MIQKELSCCICGESHGMLLYPCKCRGSLAVHFSCLRQSILIRKRKKKVCRICQSPYRGITFVYQQIGADVIAETIITQMIGTVLALVQFMLVCQFAYWWSHGIQDFDFIAFALMHIILPPILIWIAYKEYFRRIEVYNKKNPNWKVVVDVALDHPIRFEANPSPNASQQPIQNRIE